MKPYWNYLFFLWLSRDCAGTWTVRWNRSPVPWAALSSVPDLAISCEWVWPDLERGRNVILQSWTFVGESVLTCSSLLPNPVRGKGPGGSGNVVGKFPGMGLWVTSRLGTGGFGYTSLEPCVWLPLRPWWSPTELLTGRKVGKWIDMFDCSDGTLDTFVTLDLSEYEIKYCWSPEVTHSPCWRESLMVSRVSILKVPDFRNEFKWLRSRIGLHLLLGFVSRNNLWKTREDWTTTFSTACFWISACKESFRCLFLRGFAYPLSIVT